MRSAIALTLLLALAATAGAADLGNRAPVKTPTVNESVPNPDRQGGDTIFTATPIPNIPYSDTGTTTGYTDDYAGTCLYDNGAPDVVYSYHPATDLNFSITLCGSSYDTGLYVLDAGLNEIACNDDYCGLQSQVDNVHFAAGQTYYIVVDGYGAASGSYVLSIMAYLPCELSCPFGGFPEGEPPLVDGYVDTLNNGCSGPSVHIQPLTADGNGDLVLCGVSGWYMNHGSHYRDTDWFVLTMGAGGTIAATLDGEYATYFFELWPQDCATVAVAQQVTAGACAEMPMTISGYAPGAPVWFWVGPTVYEDPDGGDNEYDYVVWFSGLEPGPIAVEPTTWSTVKALYE